MSHFETQNLPLGSELHPYRQPVALPFELPTRVYGAMLAVWLLQPALHKRFPLHRQRRDDYLKFLSWCVVHGRRRYKLLREIPEWDKELMQPVELPPVPNDRWRGAFTVGMYLGAIARAKYWHSQVLAKASMRHRAARWYFRDGRSLMALERFPTWQRQAIQRNFPDAEAFLDALVLPKDHGKVGEIERIHANNKDVTKSWGDQLVEAPEPSSVRAVNAPKILQWASRALPVEANELAFLQKMGKPKPTQEQLAKVMSLVVPREGKGQLNVYAPKGKAQAEFPWGVNLFGYARGELGIGEDVRMLARSLEAAGVPFCVVNVEPGADVSQADTSAEDWIVSSPRYSTSIFCMTGIEMTRFVLEKGRKMLEGRYNIGLWPWELPDWPKPWHHAWSLVDEIWGISQYTANSYRHAPVPVKPMPLPVVLGEVSDKGRAEWGLPNDAYLFVFSFDMNSRLSRKNPQGVVQAFKRAFPDQGSDEVGLILKVSHVNPDAKDWKRLMRRIGNDRRIHLITSELRRPDVLALYKGCDCFVSLHRAEGFGRGIAEAMLLDLDLIVTGFSGNMDFCKQPSVGLVDYEMRQLAPGEYFYGEGQSWADPDLGHAAALMKERAMTPRNRRTQRYDVERFMPGYCGAVYAHRLRETQDNKSSLIDNYSRSGGK